MTREELVATVLADPEALWATRVAKVQVLGPWCAATSEARKVVVVGGVWRLDPNGKDKAVVYPSSKLSEPLWHEYTTYVDANDVEYTNDEQYEDDLDRYKKESALWKPWSFRVDQNSYDWRAYGDRKGYADTMEEAMALADAVLREIGVLLVEGSNPPVPA